MTKRLEAVAALEALPIEGTVTSVHIDVTEDASVDAAAQSVSDAYGRVDVLINNAGVVSLNPVKRDALREALTVNLVGSVSVTEAFLSLLRNSSSPRIIFVSSSLGSLTHSSDPTSRYYNPAGMEYRASKSGLSMVIIQYQHRLKNEGFKVFGADPGLVATNLTADPDSLRQRGASEADVGGERVASVVRGDRDADVRRVCGEYGVSPW